MPGGKGGAKRINPFTGEDYANVIGPLIGELMGVSEVDFPGKGGAQRVSPIPGVDIGRIQKAIRTPHHLEKGAAGILSGPTGPRSFLQGSQGALGTAGGLFGQAAEGVGADPLGARPAFQNFLSQGFTDVASDPATQRLLAVQAGQAQEFLNRNLGDIGATAQRASGGLGTGTAEASAKGRALAQAASGLAAQQAQTLFGEQARRQGIQLAAAQQGLGQGLREAATLGQLGGALGELGLGAGRLGGGLLGQQIGLGGTLQGRGVAAELFPMEQAFRLGELLKSTSGVRQPGFLEQLGGLAGGLGSAATGVADLF